MVGSGPLAGLPDFWSIAAISAALAFVVVVASAAGSWYFTPGVFGGFGAVVFWWIATGLDGWATNGGGVRNSVEGLADPATAGSGAFGGVISTPTGWVFASVAVSLLCGSLLGYASVALSGVLNFIDRTEAESAAPAPA